VLNYAKNKTHQPYLGKLKFFNNKKNLFLILNFRCEKYWTKNGQ